MGVFIGESKNTNAVRAALGINWAVQAVLRPKFDAKWPDLKDNYVLGHGVGVETGEALIVRAGVRDNNDLVSIGGAPNVAAKLSDLRATPNIYITKAVYDGMNDQNKTASDGRSMWADYGSVAVGGKNYYVKSSTWWWEP
jgi:class 3 adenylate cyclase